MQLSAAVLASLTLASVAGELAYAGSSREQQFAFCLKDTMRAYPDINPLAKYLRSMHQSPNNFDVYLTACMMAYGFVAPDAPDTRCLEPKRIENEAYCFEPKP